MLLKTAIVYHTCCWFLLAPQALYCEIALFSAICDLHSTRHCTNWNRSKQGPPVFVFDLGEKCHLSENWTWSSHLNGVYWSTWYSSALSLESSVDNRETVVRRIVALFSLLYISTYIIHNPTSTSKSLSN